MTETCGKISMSILPPGLRARLSPEQQLALSCTSGAPAAGLEVVLLCGGGVDGAGGEVEVVRAPPPGAALPAGFRSRVGEIAVRGPTVFSGYSRRGAPLSTPGAFFSSGEPGAAPFFRTGDVGAWEGPFGYLAVLDRVKDMILVGGENVYPAEVDAALAAHRAVAVAASFGVPHPVMGEIVAAAVVLRPGAALVQPARELAAWCGARLAGFKARAPAQVENRVEGERERLADPPSRCRRPGTSRRRCRPRTPARCCAARCWPRTRSRGGRSRSRT